MAIGFHFHPPKYLFKRYRHRLDKGATTSPTGSSSVRVKTINQDIRIVSEECKLDSEVRETGKVEITKLCRPTTCFVADHYM